MAPSSTAQQALLSPAELAYLRSSLSLAPPIRPDARLPTQFRPLVAETDVLPGTNGSARVCFVDGTEAVVGVKAEVERTAGRGPRKPPDVDMPDAEEEDEEGRRAAGTGERGWVDMTIEIPGYRDDDALPVFLAAMLNEALLATGALPDRLWINSGWHWRLYIDILLLSAPLSYPVPLLSLATHLALLSTRLPALRSELDEDPFFDDDWDAAVPLYGPSAPARPPVTLLVVSVGPNLLFDPTREELAVADAVLAVSLTASARDGGDATMQVLSIRTIDPPSRLTAAATTDVLHSAGLGVPAAQAAAQSDTGTGGAKRTEEGTWRPPRGGMPRGLVARVTDMCVAKGGVGEEVLSGLAKVDVG